MSIYSKAYARNLLLLLAFMSHRQFMSEAHNPKVGGSNPPPAIKKIKDLR